MPKYRVQIVAKNFLVNMEGTTSKYGFVTYRYVEALDPQAAELSAVQMLRDDQNLRNLVLNTKDDPPVMDVEEIAVLESSDEPNIPPGFIWFEMNPKRWWQFWRR